MTTTEDRLTAALNARADLVKPEDLTHHHPPAAPRSSSRVPRAVVYGLGAAAAAAAIAAPFVLRGETAPSQPEPGVRPGLSSPSHTALRPGGKKLSVEAEVFYARVGTNSLVARHVRVPDRGDPIRHALELAATKPTDPGLTSVVPRDSIPQAGFDGFGRYAAFSLAFADRTWIDRPATMGVAEARLAQRAVLCTVQSFGGIHGGHQPVHLYLESGATAGTRLFGVALPPTRHHAMEVDCS